MVFSQLVSAASIERGDAVYEPWLTNSELSAQLAPSRLPLPLPSPEPVESGRRTQHVSSGRGRGRPPGSLGSCTKWCTKYETVRAEPLGDGRERRYIAAWFPPGDDQKGRPVSAHTFRELSQPSSWRRAGQSRTSCGCSAGWTMTRAEKPVPAIRSRCQKRPGASTGLWKQQQKPASTTVERERGEQN